MKVFFRSITVSITFLFISLHVFAQEFPVQQDHFVIKDLAYEMFYKVKGKDIPYLPGINEGLSKRIYFKVDTNYSEDTKLHLNLISGDMLMVNQQVIFNLQQDSVLELDLETVKSYDRYRAIEFSIFNAKKINPEIHPYVFINREQVYFTETTLRPQIRIQETERNYLLLIALVVGIYLAVMINPNRRAFVAFYDYRNLFGTKNMNEELENQNLFSGDIFPVTIYQAMILSFLLICYSYCNVERVFIDFNFADNYLLSWLLLTPVVLVAIIVKYLLMILINNLFNLNNYTHRYMIDYFRSSKIVYEISVLIVLSVILSSFSNLGTVMYQLAWILVIIAIIRLVFIFIRLRFVGNFKYLHLISYLCIAEALPIALGVKFFIYS